MKALFIGGTGLISTAVSALALERGWDLTLANRGQHRSDVPEGAKTVTLDVNDPDAFRAVMEGQYYDVIVNWILFKPEQAERDADILLGHCGQYIGISSCASYERPMRNPVVTESTPQNNVYWQYGRDKRAIEEALFRAYRETGFPVTIVRPSLTYGNTQIHLAMGSWQHPWTMVQRILDDRPIVVQGDGSSLWPMTHNTDFAKGFVGLMGNHKAIGEAFHITTDELLTWDEITNTVGRVVGKTPKLVHITSDQIIRFYPDMEGTLLGDKSSSTIMDNTKIKRFVPDFVCTVSFEEGVRRAVRFFNEHPELKTIDEDWNEKLDTLIAADEKFRP